MLYLSILCLKLGFGREVKAPLDHGFPRARRWRLALSTYLLAILKMHHDGLALLVRDDKGFTPSRCDPAEVTALILSLNVFAHDAGCSFQAFVRVDFEM